MLITEFEKINYIAQWRNKLRTLYKHSGKNLVGNRAVHTHQYTEINAVFVTFFRAAMLIAATVLISACGQGSPFTDQAVPGQTIMVALTESKGADLIHASEITAQFTDANGGLHDVNVRSAIRVYPDPVSNFGIGGYTKTPLDILDPEGCWTWRQNNNRGQWVAIVDLRYANDSPIDIGASATGLGAIRFYKESAQIGQDHPLTIISQTSSLSALKQIFKISGNSHNMLDHLEPQPYLSIDTQGIESLRQGGSQAAIAGAMFKVKYNPANFSAARLRVTRLTNNPFLQMATRTDDAASPLGWKELTIVMSNPNGFRETDVTLNSPPLGNQSLERDLSSLVITWTGQKTSSEVTPSNWTNYFDSNIEAAYYDIDGNELVELSAVLVPAF